MTHLLFSYGTLRYPAVQEATFGRRMPMRDAVLPGYVLDTVVIGDARVVELSGSAEHPFARRTGDPADVVDGVVIELTDAELAAADDYEVDDYARVSVTLAGGETAWMYVDATDLPEETAAP